MIYNEMVMPFEMVSFEEMNKKQVKQYFEWFMLTLDERCNRLQNYINLTEGNVVLNKSPESLVGLCLWAGRSWNLEKLTRKK